MERIDRVYSTARFVAANKLASLAAALAVVALFAAMLFAGFRRRFARRR